MTAAHEPTLAEREAEVWERTARLRGWAAAAALHRKAEGVAGDVCEHCTTQLNTFRTDDDYAEVGWPCRTAVALGVAR